MLPVVFNYEKVLTAEYSPHTHHAYTQVLVVFYNARDFDSIAVPSNTTAREVVDHRYISVQLDLKGVANR